MNYKSSVLRRAVIAVFLLILLGGVTSYFWYQDWRDHSQDAPILSAARHYGVQPALVKAVVWRESRFNPDARGSRGEIGLMQIIPNAAAKDWVATQKVSAFAPEHLFNPTTNTLIGAWYLEKLLKRYAQTDDPVPYVLADYNAGRSNVLRWKQGVAATNSAEFIRQINFPSTRKYVLTVMKRYRHYQPIFPPKPNN